MKTIVVAYGGSEEASGRALERAADLAEAFGAELVVASIAPLDQQVIPNPIVPTESVILPPSAPAADLLDEADEELGRAREVLARRGLSAEYVTGIGRPAEAILDIADERQASLVVVGSHESSFLDRILRGSVSEDVSRRAHCDVLIVH